MSFKSWLACLFPGLLLSHMFYGNIAAAEFIPAAVAALLFFIFPPLVTIINAAVDRRPPSPMKLGATLIAFAGLAVMLGVSLDDLDWRGVALGLSAGVFCAINITWVSRKLSHIDPVVSMTHMALVAAVCLTGATLFFGGTHSMPSGGAGWAAMLGAAAMQASCIPLFYIVLPVIGPERMGILSNIQPVATIIRGLSGARRGFTTDAVPWGHDDPWRHLVDAICRQARATRYSARTLSRTGSKYSRNAAGFSDIGKCPTPRITSKCAALMRSASSWPISGVADGS